MQYFMPVKYENDEISFKKRSHKVRAVGMVGVGVGGREATAGHQLKAFLSKYPKLSQKMPKMPIV